MKANIYDLEGKTIKEIELPEYFAQDYRPDLIKKAVISSQSKGYQAMGVSPYSNRNYTSIYIGRRKENKTENTPQSPTLIENKISFLPKFGKLKDLFSKFSYEQRIYALIILLLIFVVPYFGVKIEKRIAEKKAAQTAQNTPQIIIPLEQDINVTRISELTTLSQRVDSVSRIINLNGKLFFIGSSEIFDLEKNLSFSFPSEIGTVQNSTGMNDLNLILLITEDKRVFSFSPTSKKFQSNLIEIPPDVNITASETYLTYLYLLDSKTGQIFRYPRAEGGFGIKADWLKDTTNLSKISDISINENIFAASSNEIFKLFKGKRQDFSVQETATPIIFDWVYASKSNLEIYVLDKTNARIVHLSPEGNILNQYYNEKLKEAGSFSVDEENKNIYFSAGNIIYSFIGK